MKTDKRKALEAAGFRVGGIADFLGLSAEEQAIVELRVAVGRQVRTLREKRRLSQQQLAARIRSSQSRVVKIEAATPGVSLDLAFRGLFAVGGKISDLTVSRGRPLSRPRRGGSK